MSELAARYRERVVALGLPTEPDHRRDRLGAALDRWLAGDGFAPGPARQQLVLALVDELAGLGPLEALLADERVSEILVNGLAPIHVEVEGRLHVTDQRFDDADQVRAVIERMLVGTGRRIDDGAPLVDARLTDGSRLNAVLPPVAVGGPLVTIRRPARRRRDAGDLVDGGSLDPRIAAFLHAAVLGRCNIVVEGGSGSGKTTLLAALADLVPPDQRLVVLEDTAELRLVHPHAARLECRPAGRDGTGEIVLRDLVRNSLRMRPDRIVVGEVRGAEAADMLQAMNTGHEGSMATLHANSTDDALHRLESMLAMAWPALDATVLRRWIGSAVDIVVHCERLATGQRVVAAVAVIGGEEEARLEASPVFVRRHDGRVDGVGEVPSRCLDRMARHGVTVPPSLFAAWHVA